MTSFSGVTFVLFCFVFVYAFIEAAALASFNRPSLCRRPDSHTFFFLSFFPLIYLEMSLFPSIFCTIAVFSLYGEYVVRFSLLDGVFSTL